MALTKKTIKEISASSGYEPSDKELEKILWVSERLDQMDDNKRQEKEKEWKEADEAYKPTRDTSGKWQSTIVPPMTTSIIEAEISHVIEYDTTPFLVGRTAADDKYAALKLKILEYTKDKGKFKYELFKILKSTLIRGDGIAIEFVYRDTRKVQIPKNVDKKTGKIVYEEVDKTFFELPYLKAIPLEDVYFDETATSLRGPNGCKDAIYIQYYQLEAFKNKYRGKTDPLGNAKFVRAGGKTTKGYSFKKDVGDGEIVEVLEYWNRGIPFDARWVVANGVLIDDGPNPYDHKEIPFIKASDVPDLDSFYSTGEAELLRDIQKEITTIRRMRLDRQHLQIDKMFLVGDSETSLDDDELTVRPHGQIHVGDVNNVKPLEYSDIKPSAYQEEDRLKEDATKVTGMDDRMQSSSSSSARTATEAAILKESTLQRIRTKLFLLEIDTLVDFTRLRDSNIRQYMREPKLVRILGEKEGQVYKDAVAAAKREGLLVMQEENAYRKQYPMIPIDGERFYKDKDSQDIKSEKIEGRSYLQILPEYLDPEMDVRYKAAPDLPVSKALEAQNFKDVYDRLRDNPAMDPAKLGAELLRVNGKDPDEFSLQQAGQGAPTEEVADMQKTVDLASQENEDMMKGTEVPPTPYATSKHTALHYAFMESPEFIDDPDLTIMDIFTQHILGEAKAQEQRGEASMANVPLGGAPMGGGTGEGVDPTLKALLPDQVQGGGEVPSLEPPRRNA